MPDDSTDHLAGVLHVCIVGGLAFLSILGLRLQRTMAYSDSLGNIVERVWNDMPYVLGLLGLSVLALIPLWIIGCLVSLAEPSEGAD